MAALTPTQARELELTRRGLGSFDDFSKYLESQRTVPVDTGLTAMDGSPLEGRGLDFSAEGISRGLAPARRAIGRGILNPLASLQDLIAVPASTAEALISKGLGGVSSALGATDVGQFFLDQGDKGFDRASSKLSEAIGPGQVIKPLDGTLSPADNEQLLDIFGPDPSIGRPKGMVPGKATIKPGTEGLPKKQIPDPSSNVDAAARLMMEKKQTKADANREASLTMPSGTEVSASKTEDPMGDYSGKEPAVDLFMEALADTKKAKGEEPVKAKTREELLEKYKQEFADATGIDISGKPDTSQALMAMGLSMMQNRAGKNFNVGKALDAVGKAGEKAMPALSAARKEAKAARVAAGKYALSQIKSDEDAALAIETANRALQKELYLKDVEFANDRRLKILEAQLEGGNKLTEALKNTEQQTIKIGAQEIKLGRGQDLEFNARTVWSDPVLDSKEVASAYKKTAEGLDTLQQMEGLLLDMKDIGDTNVGGTAGAKTLAKIIEVGNSMGMGLSYPSGQDVSIPSQIEVLQRSVLARFKKFLTQETGNGISNVDVADIKAALGQFETFGDIDKAIMSVASMQELFKTSQKTLDPIVDTFLDRRQYRGNKEGEYQYNEVLKMFDKSFGDVNYIDFTEAVSADGVKIKDYDIRG